MAKKTANIKVAAEIHAQFKDVIENERFIGGTLTKLMLWYVNASPTDRDAVLNGSQPSSFSDQRGTNNSQEAGDWEAQMQSLRNRVQDLEGEIARVKLAQAQAEADELVDGAEADAEDMRGNKDHRPGESA